MPSALIIIDVQQAILKPVPPHEFDAVLARIQGLIGKAKTQGVPVIWVQHNQAGSAFEYGMQSWKFVAQIAPQVGDLVIHKQSSDAFHHTALKQWLTAWGIDHLVVCGYASGFCVDTTVRSAASHDYAVTLVSDGHTTPDLPTHSAAEIRAHLNWMLPHLAVHRPADAKRPAIEAVAAADVKFEPHTQTFEQFDALHRAGGFPPALVRTWKPGEVAELHTHPFEFSALLVEGRFLLESEGQSRQILPGERFTLPANQAHAERYGPDGASYWVARREVLAQ